MDFWINGVPYRLQLDWQLKALIEATPATLPKILLALPRLAQATAA